MPFKLQQFPATLYLCSFLLSPLPLKYTVYTPSFPHISCGSYKTLARCIWLCKGHGRGKRLLVSLPPHGLFNLLKGNSSIFLSSYGILFFCNGEKNSVFHTKYVNLLFVSLCLTDNNFVLCESVFNLIFCIGQVCKYCYRQYLLPSSGSRHHVFLRERSLWDSLGC